VVALYQHDLTGRPLVETLGPNASLFARALAHAAVDRAEELDQVIDRHAHGWSVQRIQPLERSIMRVALIEMLHPDVAPGEQPIPAEGAIEEAVESAKTFCGSEAPAFVNGVLGAVLREMRGENMEPSESSSDRAAANPKENPPSFRIASKPIQ
jgi:N utilization substance protein B